MGDLDGKAGGGENGGTGKADAPAAEGAPPAEAARTESAAPASADPSSESLPASSPVPVLSGWGRMFRDMQNVITVAGVTLATAGAITLLTYFALDVFWGFRNHYISLIVYLFLPTLFSIGLVMIPVGIWRTRKRRARGGETRSRQPYPVIDFKLPRVRLAWVVVISLTFVNVVLLGMATYKGLEYTDSVEFCGDVCHSVMRPQEVSHRDSAHSRVPCVRCHIGEGASWFVRSKASGLRQVWAMITGDYSRPVPAPVENLRPARETCERCHWPQKFYGDRLVMRVRYGEDEHNTPSRIVLLIKTGGGDPDLGMHGGIHWFHMDERHNIDFVPADRQQQKIAWVRYRNPEGEVFEFTNGEAARPAGATVRRMDCVTCHNQPTHGYRMPGETIDLAIETGRIDADLPFVKARGLALIKGTYASEAQARDAIRKGLASFYQQDHPQIWSQRRSSIDAAARALGDIWARNVFPEMRVTWGTYPNNVGHMNSPGCFRCHNDKMRMTSGPRRIAVSTDCQTCHMMTFMDDGDLTIPRAFLGLD